MMSTFSATKLGQISYYTCLKQEARSLALNVKDLTLALIFTVVPCTAYEDSSVLTGLVALALISDFGMMTRQLFKAGRCLFAPRCLFYG